MGNSYREFTQEIIKDFNLEPKKECRRYFDHFPIIDGKKKINASNTSFIVDRQGNTFDYMTKPWGNVRNEEKLKDFDYILTIGYKTLDELCTEAGLNLKSEKCKICEGNGWYTWGRRYFYKDLTIEV